MVHRVADTLNEKGRAINGSRILVLGVTYKKNVDDMRESRSLHIMDMLLQKGAEVDYSDPYVPVFPRLRKFAFNLKSRQLTEETIQSYDCLLLATDHNDFDYDSIARHVRLIVDTRGRYVNGEGNIWPA